MINSHCAMFDDLYFIFSDCGPIAPIINNTTPILRRPSPLHKRFWNAREFTISRQSTHSWKFYFDVSVSAVALFAHKKKKHNLQPFTRQLLSILFAPISAHNSWPVLYSTRSMQNAFHSIHSPNNNNDCLFCIHLSVLDHESPVQTVDALRTVLCEQPHTHTHTY